MKKLKLALVKLITAVQENIKFLKIKQMKKKIKMIEGDFE